MARLLLISLLGSASLLLTSSLHSREPSDLEQYYLELVNRARANPTDEVARLSGKTWGDSGSPVAADLNEGIAPDTISASPKPPLAFDTRLIDAASDYSDHLLATEQFSHTAQGNPPSRMTAAGYTFTPPSMSGENLATTALNAAYPLNRDRVDDHHEGLFIDGDVAGRGHRISLMAPEFREVGIAIRTDSDGVSIFGDEYNEILSTQNFALSTGRLFVTGVIYHDLSPNLFYDPGESAGVLSISVRTSGGTTVASGTSFASGGYSINLNGIAPGTYDLVASDALGNEETASFSWTGSRNVKVDLVNPNFTLPPLLGVPFRPDGRIGLTSTGLTGNDAYSDTTVKQTVKQIARTTRPLFWQVRFENDGTQVDTLKVTGTQGTPLYRLTYRHLEGSSLLNVTAALRTGRVDLLQSGEERSYEISVKPEKRSLGKRTPFNFSLRAVSTSAPDRTDRVNGQLLNRTKKPRR